MNWDREKIEQGGYCYLETKEGDMLGLGYMQKAAFRHDYRHSDTAAFRFAEGQWAIFTKPGAVKGFVSEALLP